MTGIYKKPNDNSKPASNDFYVVGGPVQPDRPCYILRRADEKLFRSLRENEFCYLLGPKQLGKTSLMISVARRLSDDGELVSVVDLTQVLSREAEGTDPGRWFYGIAYRIVRDLRLRFDLQSWWQARGGLATQHRLVEFFWEVVLANTTAPVTVFFDEIENTLGLPFSKDFFSGLRACFNSRAAEPDFNRLRFVFLGVAVPERLCRDPQQGPFVIARRIEVDDFTIGEACGLLPGLGLDASQGARAMDRIMYWTGGQPYLTQKLCRALSRRDAGEKVSATVDELVQVHFLAKNRSRDEPNLSGVRRRLSGKRRHILAALAQYGALQKGRSIEYDSQSLAHQELALSGLVSVDGARCLRVRNRIYDRVFSKTWVNQSLPFDWKSVATAAGVAVLLLFVPFWYTQILPRPYIETLGAVTEDYQLALSAYNDLRSIPGFAGTADRLFSSVLRRRSLRATTLPQALEADLGLRSLPNNSEIADQLLGAFWDRQALRAETDEQRDAALLYRINSLVDDTPLRRRQIAALIGLDYPLLSTTIRPLGDLAAAVISADGATVSSLTREGALQTWDGRTGDPLHAAATMLTAEAFVVLEREILVNLDGPVRGMTLRVMLKHASPDQLSLFLVSPQGMEVELNPGTARRDSDWLVFDNAASGALAPLVGQMTRGAWQLRIEDRQKRYQGTLGGWELVFTAHSSQPQRDLPESPVAIPQPRSTDRTTAVLGDGGKLAAAFSENTALGGLVNVWDVVERRQKSQPVKAPGLVPFSFARNDELLLAIDDRGARLVAWDTGNGDVRFEISTQGELGLPTLDGGGRYLVVRDRQSDEKTVARVFDLQAGEEMYRIPFAAPPMSLAIDSEGRWLASSMGDKAVDVWDLQDSELVDEFLLGFQVSSLRFGPRGRWLASFAADGEANIRPAPGRRSRSLGVELAAPQALVISRDSDAALVFQSGAWRVISLPAGQSLSPTLRHPASGGLIAAMPSPGLVMTGGDDSTLKLWALPPRTEGTLHTSRYGIGSGFSASTVFGGGELVAAGFEDGSVRFWQRNDGDMIVSMIPASGAFPVAITALAFSRDAGRLAIADSAGGIRLIDLAQNVQQALGHQAGIVTDLEFNADASRLAAAGDRGARLWFVDQPDREPVALGSEDPVSQVTFSADGGLLAISPVQGEMSVWYASSGDAAGSIRPRGQVSSAVFSPDGQFLVIGNNDGALQFWDLDSGSNHWPVIELGGGVKQLLFSPSGEGLYALSTGWVHYLSLPDSGPRPSLNRLLPEPMPRDSLFAPAGGEIRIDYIDWIEGDALSIRSLPLEQAGGRAWPGSMSGLESHWKKALHLEISDDGEVKAGHSVFEMASGVTGSR